MLVVATLSQGMPAAEYLFSHGDHALREFARIVEAAIGNQALQPAQAVRRLVAQAGPADGRLVAGLNGGELTIEDGHRVQVRFAVSRVSPERFQHRGPTRLRRGGERIRGPKQRAANLGSGRGHARR